MAEVRSELWYAAIIEKFAIALSIRRGSTFAWTTPSVQLRQAYFGPTVRSAPASWGSRPARRDVLADLVNLALAARARGRLRQLLTTRLVLGQRPDVAVRPHAGPVGRLRRGRIVVGGAGFGLGSKIMQLERQLPFSSAAPLSEDDLPECLHRPAQLLFRASSASTISHPSPRIGRESVGANRHDQTIRAYAACSSKIFTPQPTMAGCFSGSFETRVHSSPSSIPSCVDFRCTTPLWHTAACGMKCRRLQPAVYSGTGTTNLVPDGWPSLGEIASTSRHKLER